MKPANLLRPTFLTAVAVALTSSGAAAQVVATGVSYETYSFANAAATNTKSVSLLTIPFGAAIVPVSWATISVRGAYASGTAIATDDSESTISGLTDTSIQLALPFSRDRFVIGASLVLPTGKSTYSASEAQLAGMIAADLLPFRISNWGSGGALDLSSAITVPLGSVNVGARVGYQMAREFDLLEGESFLYRPGNQLNVRLAADATAGAGRVTAEVNLYQFTEDQVNSQNLYQSGNRLNGMLTYTRPVGAQGSAALYAGAMNRQHGTFLDGSGDTPAQMMLLFGGGMRRPIGSATLVPAVDLRLLRSDDGIGQGYIAGVGATLEFDMANGGMTLLPMARARFGNLQAREGVETGITGFEFGAGIRFGSAGR